MITAIEKGGDNKRMHLRCGPFRWPLRCSGAIPQALPDEGCPGLS